jgi:hypothetical protein
VNAFCDVQCVNDADCVGWGSRSRCDQGFCRTLNSACARGETAANEVVLLGDSFIAQSHELTQALAVLAQSSGALASGESYRDYSTLIGNNLSAEPPGISLEYATAQEDGAVKVVIMAGGGADVLASTCPSPVAQDCQVVEDVLAGAEQLFQTMADDQVEHVVFFSYPDYVGNDSIKATIDVLRPALEQRCADAPLPCYFLDLRPAFAGNYDAYVLPDGRNPTTAGAGASAEAIWSLMQRHCIAQ